MMVMAVRLRLLRPIPHGRQPSSASVIFSRIVFLQSPPLAASRLSTRLCRLHGRLFGRPVAIVATVETAAAVGHLGPCRNRARQGADTSADSGKHTPEFALDARLTRRTRKLGLGALHGLWQRGNAAFSVDLLDREQAALVAVRGAHILHRPVPGRLVHGRTHVPVGDGRRGNRRLLSRTRRRVLGLGPVQGHRVHALAIGRAVRLRVRRPRGRKTVLMMGVRGRMVTIDWRGRVRVRPVVMRCR